ncbi:hypothetical protein EOPP23_05205 [Endozoicomonas sp. OPT23]|uniref:V-type ATP synthase subunit I n=1 Tax=Endozoicomonas sp. OPT23 TaxID=2072845 RepID=UPI00129B84B3|nr:hypothetical protein [Endozoicomonas sp. OPT23]MRI32380.1 hypothetical protein [Endozoicomonas sp. OPT23]
MAIEALYRMTLYGPADKKQKVLSGLQEVGCLHLIPLAPDNSQTNDSNILSTANEAVQWLERVPSPRRQFKESSAEEINRAIEKTLQNKSQYRAVSDKRDKLQERIQEVTPWGDFSFPDLNELHDQRLWFYVVPDNSLDDFFQSAAANSLCYKVIHQSLVESYIVIISLEDPEQKLPAPRSHVGEISLSSLESELEISEQQLDELLAEREDLSRWLHLISTSVARLRDQVSLTKASTGTLNEEEFFLIQGWLPKVKESLIKQYCKEHCLAVQFEPPTPNDAPPTLLQKSASVGGGADALGFFQTPGYRTWDPGKTVFFSFSLFFAMIISDACYSLLIGIIVFFIKRRISSTAQNKRLLNLGFIMALFGLIWGCMVGSYFGVSPKEGLLADLAIINLNDYNAMMRLSIIIGVFHLLIANLMSAVSLKDSSASLVPLGWSINLLAGLLGWLGMTEIIPKPFFSTIAPALLTVGSILVLFFSDNRPVHSIKDALLRLISGLKSLYNISSAFGDVLSYMRLFALGLSGASLALTFNSLAASALQSSPVMGVLSSALILLFGHLLNFALCVMSGVVHGMRLNVIEFVNWGIPEEGYPFQSFCKHEVSQWTH